MLEFIGQPLAVVLVFGLVIFVHELGHFLAAKATGVLAPRFSVGFGPALWKRKYGETEYILAAIPLGGYVRMASREDRTMQSLEGGGEDLDAVPPHRWFESKSLPARLLILGAGVTMNVLLGFVILAGLRMTYGQPVINTTVVGDVQAVAETPGLPELLSVGDTIRSVDGTPVSHWRDVEQAIVREDAGNIVFATQRGPIEVQLGADPAAARRRVAGAIAPWAPPVLGPTMPGNPAYRSGLREGDSVVAVAGTPVATWYELVREIRASPGRTIEFDLIRGGQRRQIAVRPDTARSRDRVTGEERVIGQIGVAIDFPISHIQQSAGSAIRDGWGDTWFMAGAIVQIVRRLVIGDVSPRTLGGPVAIARESAAAARRGLEPLLQLVALLSINVAVLNLLPIPILDGGQILLNIAEAAKGSAFSVRTRENLMRVGLAAILLLIVFVLFNDLRNHLPF